MDKKERVAFAKFIKELKNKYVYHKNGGKSFRQLISLNAFIMSVESEIKRAEYFLDRKNVKHVVGDSKNSAPFPGAVVIFGIRAKTNS